MYCVGWLGSHITDTLNVANEMTGLICGYPHIIPRQPGTADFTAVEVPKHFGQPCGPQPSRCAHQDDLSHALEHCAAVFCT